jgi:hypothetical protein
MVRKAGKSPEARADSWHGRQSASAPCGPSPAPARLHLSRAERWVKVASGRTMCNGGDPAFARLILLPRPQGAPVPLLTCVSVASVDSSSAFVAPEAPPAASGMPAQGGAPPSCFERSGSLPKRDRFLMPCIGFFRVCFHCRATKSRSGIAESSGESNNSGAADFESQRGGKIWLYLLARSAHAPRRRRGFALRRRRFSPSSHVSPSARHAAGLPGRGRRVAWHGAPSPSGTDGFCQRIKRIETNGA